MIDILLATYNGEKYIKEQLESILKQTFTDWTLYIRDDGSKDNTVKIVKEYIAKYPGKINLIEDGKRGLGAKLNFAELLKYSKQDYAMFCDQDDQWIENKIQITFEKIKMMENNLGTSTPILIHTDLKVVDEKLNIINESFWNFTNIDAKRNSVNYLMVQNTVTGCTAMINKALKDLSYNIPEKCIMHDWWIAIIASSMGKIGIVDTPTILYRQHGGNEVGAKTYTLEERAKRKFKDPKSLLDVFSEEISQMEDFYAMFKNSLDEKNKKLIFDFINLRKYNIVKRKSVMMKNKYYVKETINRVKNLIFV